MQIRFDGPPGHEAGRFVEVEDDHGRSISYGDWVQDGEYWLLKYPGVGPGTVRSARRDMFAAAALSGMLADPASVISPVLARHAVSAADHLLAALDAEPGGVPEIKTSECDYCGCGRQLAKLGDTCPACHRTFAEPGGVPETTKEK